MLGQMLENVRKKVPLVHHITNYVTVNDCANIILACGGSPIMADDISEVEEITAICDALVINIGTLNSKTVKAMLLAGYEANQRNKPVILDPVGVGASKLRTDTVKALLKEVEFTVIRGNISEMKRIGQCLQEGLGEKEHREQEKEKERGKEKAAGDSRGVDASLADCITEENLESIVAYAKALSMQTDAVIVITGAIDIVADMEKAYIIRNGHPTMSKITGSGCMLTSILGACCAANQKHLTNACAAAVCAMGLSGEYAFKKVSSEAAGTGSFRTYLIDYISRLDGNDLEQGAKLQEL